MTTTRNVLLFRVTGRVQGVGFRWSMAQEAQRLGLDGWVRNRRDGSVEALAHGEAAALAALCAWAERGPPMARVDRVMTEPWHGDLPATGFEQRATD